MSHHYSGPDFSFPHGDARVDQCDLYAFPASGDAGRSVLVMDVHPSIGFNPPGPTTTEPFSPEALYELKVDTDGDGVADVGFRTDFSTADNGLSATLRRIEGPDAAGTGDDGEILIQDAPVSMGTEAQVTESGGYRFFAGWRSDPFFFDAGGALNDFQYTGEDFFADKDICSIAIEMPNDTLGASGRVGLWARTLVRESADGDWVQVDRGARAQQSVFFCPGEEKASYLGGEPATDERFIDSFAHVLQHAGGYAAEDAKRAAGTLLPDVLPYDPREPVAYPKNGRALTDDVTDHFMGIFTNGKAGVDGVGPHSDLLHEFPHLGPPHGSYS
jgi:hypothetical protein